MPSFLRIAVLALLMALLAGPSIGVRGQAALPQQSDNRQREPVFRSATELVALNVTVNDEKGGAIVGLREHDFKVYEDGVEQPIGLFNAEQAPASWGLLLDRSGSMRDMMDDVYQAALHAIDDGTDDDETFIAAFSERVDLVSDFQIDKHRLENALLGLRPGGGTALWDAVVFGLNHIRDGQHKKRVVMVITDGEDNQSEVAFRDLVERAERAEVLIYPVGMMGSMAKVPRWLGGGADPMRRELEKLAEVTGGRAHFPADIRECRETMQAIAREVSHQYSIGYYPTNTRRDGKWRKIRVDVAPTGRSKATARARPGYYAPASQG